MNLLRLGGCCCEARASKRWGLARVRRKLHRQRRALRKRLQHLGGLRGRRRLRPALDGCLPYVQRQALTGTGSVSEMPTVRPGACSVVVCHPACRPSTCSSGPPAALGPRPPRFCFWRRVGQAAKGRGGGRVHLIWLCELGRRGLPDQVLRQSTVQVLRLERDGVPRMQAAQRPSAGLGLGRPACLVDPGAPARRVLRSGFNPEPARAVRGGPRRNAGPWWSPNGAQSPLASETDINKNRGLFRFLRRTGIYLTITEVRFSLPRHGNYGSPEVH